MSADVARDAVPEHSGPREQACGDGRNQRGDRHSPHSWRCLLKSAMSGRARVSRPVVSSGLSRDRLQTSSSKGKSLEG